MFQWHESQPRHSRRCATINDKKTPLRRGCKNLKGGIKTIPMWNGDVYTIDIVPQSYAQTLDYLRLTKERPYPNRRFHEILPMLQASEREKGYTPIPYTLSTMKGVLVGRVGWADSETHRMVEFRGAMAEQAYRHYLPVDCRCTRLDLAFTVWLPIHDDTVARRALHASEAWWLKEGKDMGRKPPLLHHSANGDTLELGSRSSRRFLRIYDKWLQSGDEKFRNAWRFEIELKGELAHIVWQRIQAGETVEGIAMHEIQYMLRSWKIQLSDWEEFGKRTIVPTPQRNPTIDSQLGWLGKQVRPVIKQLTEMGYGSEVWEALNFYPDITVTNVTDEG